MLQDSPTGQLTAGRIEWRSRASNEVLTVGLLQWDSRFGAADYWLPERVTAPKGETGYQVSGLVLAVFAIIVPWSVAFRGTELRSAPCVARVWSLLQATQIG
jgi:hypothetical protein